MKEKIAELYQLLFGFRKFIITLLVVVVSIIFRTKALLSGGEFVDLVKAVSLGFLGTNSVEGITTVIKEHLAARRAAGSLTTTPPDDKEDEVDPNANVEIVLPGDR